MTLEILQAQAATARADADAADAARRDESRRMAAVAEVWTPGTSFDGRLLRVV